MFYDMKAACFSAEVNRLGPAFWPVELHHVEDITSPLDFDPQSLASEWQKLQGPCIAR